MHAPALILCGLFYAAHHFPTPLVTSCARKTWGLCKLYRNKRWKQLVIFDRTLRASRGIASLLWLLVAADANLVIFHDGGATPASAILASFSRSAHVESSLTSGGFGGASQKNRQIRYWRRMERASLSLSAVLNRVNQRAARLFKLTPN